MGALAGGTGIVGTGGFSLVSAERNVSVSVAADANAYLRLAPCKGSQNGAYATNVQTGVMTLNLSPSNPNVTGEGVNPEATSVFDNVFEICNQGSQSVAVWLDADPIQNGNGNPAVEFYQDGDRTSTIVGKDNAVCLDVGECVCVGFLTRTQGLTASQDNLLDPVAGSSEIEIHAEAGAACSPPVTGGTPIPGPTGGLINYWPLDSIEDGIAEDIVGTSPGTPEGELQSVSGTVADAAAFDGTDDRITTGLNVGASNESLTVAGWLRAPAQSLGQNHFFLNNYVERPGGSGQHDGFFAIGTRDGSQMFLWIRDATRSNDVETAGYQPAFDGSWHHYVGVRDVVVDEIRFYIDGDRKEAVSFPGDVAIRDPSSFFGMMNHYGTRFLEGDVDDVRIYDRALSDGDVTDLYDATN